VLVFVLILALVGGSWIDTSLSGLWFWNFNNASSNVGTGTGARLLIGIWCVEGAVLDVLLSCRRSLAQ